MADPTDAVTMAALARAGLLGGEAIPGQDPRQAGITLAALARAGLLNDQDATGLAPPPMTLGGTPVNRSGPPLRSGVDLATQFTPAPPTGPPAADLNAIASFTPYNQPGYRPTSGMALGPQSQQEEQDLASDARGANAFMEMSGMAPLSRAGGHLAAGRPLEAAGSAATALIPYRPLAGLGALGATYGAAVGADALGALMPNSSADAQTAPRARTLADVEADLRAEEAKLKRFPNTDKGERDALPTVGRITALQAERERLNAATAAEASSALSLDTEKKRSEQAEYDRAVRAAEEARREWEARDVQWSRDTRAGRLNESLGGYGPMAAGALAGILTRGAGRAMGHGDSFTSHYVAPSITGALAGATANNAGTIYDANQTEVLNPRRRALEEELALLPPNHPRRASIQARLDNLTSMPVLNPIREQAQRQLAFVPGQPGFGPTVSRTLAGALLEGAPGGVMGSEALRWGAALLGRRPRGATTPDTPGGSSGPGAGGPGGQTGPGVQGGPGGLPEPLGPGPGSGPPPGGAPIVPQWPPPQPNVSFGPQQFSLGSTRVTPQQPPPQPPAPPPTGPFRPGVTRFRNPETGEVRELDVHGRWRGPRSGGGHGWTTAPPATWQRISRVEPSSMAQFLRG